MGVAYVLDTEATGLDAPEIIEAAWIRMPVKRDILGPSDAIDLGPLSEYQTYEERFRPTKPITFGAMATHHILPHELERCRPHTAFELPADITYMVGHSVDFDWQAAGSPPNVKRICTHALAQHVFQDCDSLSLSALLYHACGATDDVRNLVRQAHGAMADCWNVVHLLRVIVARTGIETWPVLWAYSETCREPLKMPMGRNRGTLLTECDTGELCWYLDQPWIDPYFRRALEKVVKARGRDLFSGFEDEDEDIDDAHEADMAKLRREQLEQDVGDEVPDDWNDDPFIDDEPFEPEEDAPPAPINGGSAAPC